MIEVKFLARLRETLGSESIEVEFNPGQSVGELASSVLGEAMDTSIMFARNHELCSADTLLVDGDQVALFPPVTGG